MYDKFMTNPNDVENVVMNGVVVGLNIKVKIPYYRGVCLSLVEDAKVIVGDLLGEKIYTKDQMTFTVGGCTYDFDDMETITTVRWEFGEKAILFVPVLNGISEYGPTNLEVQVKIRASYNPHLKAGVTRMTVDRSASKVVER
jgi:hypothetical protein